MALHSCAGGRLIILLSFLISTCSGAADRFQFNCNSSTAIMVRWRSTYEADSRRHFRVFLNDQIDSTCNHALDKKMFFCKIDDLVPNTPYSVVVKICSADEEDPQNCEEALGPKIICTYPQAAETFTAEAIDGDHIKFNWKLPTQTLGNLQVYASARTQDQSRIFEVSAQEGSSMTIVDGLRPLTEYNATMYVRNTDYNLENSSTQVIRVLTAPDPPTIKIIEVGQTWMKVSLVPAAGSENFQLTYVVTATSEHAPAKECTTSDQTDQRQCTLSGLETAAGYSVTAKACNGKQCSLESQPIIQQLESTASPSKEETTTSEPTTSSGPCWKFAHAVVIVNLLLARTLITP
ncbi:hypothetical protein SprV_0802561200 [Sparganum proliferum]